MTDDVKPQPVDFEILKMDPELKARWLEWLRDPTNQQGQGALRRSTYDGNHSYCCLGVLCEIHDEVNFAGISPGVSRVEYRFPAFDGFTPPPGGMGQYAETVDDEVIWSSTSYIPTPLAVKMGINGETQRYLAHLNDNMQWSFEKIAAWVEEHM